MKATLTLIAIASVMACQAQDDFATYKYSFGIDTVLQIDLSTDKQGKFKLWINTGKDDVGFAISQRQHSGFLQALQEAKLKYEEWTKTAQANNVTKFSK